jgi:hypothetical protein
MTRAPSVCAEPGCPNVAVRRAAAATSNATTSASPTRRRRQHQNGSVDTRDATAGVLALRIDCWLDRLHELEQELEKIRDCLAESSSRSGETDVLIDR